MASLARAHGVGEQDRDAVLDRIRGPAARAGEPARCASANGAWHRGQASCPVEAIPLRRPVRTRWRRRARSRRGAWPPAAASARGRRGRPSAGRASDCECVSRHVNRIQSRLPTTWSIRNPASRIRPVRNRSVNRNSCSTPGTRLTPADPARSAQGSTARSTPPGPKHPVGLTKRPRRIGDMVERHREEDGVEGSVRERQRLHVRDDVLCQQRILAPLLDHRPADVDPDHRRPLPPARSPTHRRRFPRRRRESAPRAPGARPPTARSSRSGAPSSAARSNRRRSSARCES